MASFNGSICRRSRAVFGGPWLAVIALVSVIAGCATGPQYPLYSPLAVTGTFGYTEQRINETTYRVTYITPARTAYSPYARSGTSSHGAAQSRQ